MSSGRLTLVSAPAGFGKTALLADWSSRGDVPVAWVSLDAGDNDPGRFWRHVVAALDRARPGIAAGIAPLLESLPPLSFDGLVTLLSNEIAAGSEQVRLIIDDYHLIEAEPVHTSLQVLLRHPPPQLQVVLITRSEPQLPLARLRARGQLLELRAADLRFRLDEAESLLRVGVGSALTDDAVATLVARTEGWAVGLQLAALSMRGRSDAGAFIDSFSGTHRYVLDYLTEEVMSHQPKPVREFLRETSVLARLSGPLCDAVTGRHDGQRMLEEIEAANLFLVPLDEQRDWWRYHHLFADLLRAQLVRRQPERVRDLHQRAATWHDQHGLADDAVRHAMSAGDTIRAAQLIERHFDELCLNSERATVKRWLAALPADVVAARPRLNLAYASLGIIGGSVKDVVASLDLAARGVPDTADVPFHPSVGWAASQLANVSAAIAVGRAYTSHLSGDVDSTVDMASKAVADLDESEWMLTGLARSNLAIAAWMSGSVHEAELAMTTNVAHWRAVGHPGLVAMVSGHLGRIQCAQGMLDSAWKTYSHVRDLAVGPGGVPLPAAGGALVGLAEVDYQRGDLDDALGHVNQGVTLCRRFIYTEFLARGLVTLAGLRQATGDPDGATAALDEATALTDPIITDLLNSVPVARARLQLAQGDIDAAARWVAERGLSPDDDPVFARESAHLVMVRVLLAEEDPLQALQLLDRLHAAATVQGRIGSVIEIQALRALALAALEDHRSAAATLVDALVTAHPHGHTQVFVDEGAGMAALLGRVIADRRFRDTAIGDIPASYLRRIIEAFDRDESTPSGLAGLVTPLTDRELEVLRLLAAGRQNQDIATELFVAQNTVKKHVTHILAKLGASNRTEAVARARGLGLRWPA